MKNKKIYLVVVCMFVGSYSFAELKSDDADSLQKTQNLLKDKAAREAFIKENPEAQQHVNQMNSLGMSANQQNEIYGVSSEIFAQLIKENNGDSVAVSKMLLEAQKNPEAFYKSLSPESQAKIKAMGFQLEEKNSPNKPK